MSAAQRLVLALLAASAPAFAAPPLCRVSLTLEPEAPFVGQEVIWSLRIERRRDVVGYDFAEAPTFPEFRAEWLPGRTEAAQTEAILVSEERRALFPAAAGSLVLPRASLRCESPERIEVAEIAGRALRVRPLPARGRPRGFGGLVGEVRVSAALTPERVQLGESTRLGVVVEGEVAAWDAALAPLALGEAADVFPHPPELARDSGRRLSLRRHFSWDLAPRREGVLVLPEFRVDYFDPKSGRYRVASARPPRLRVDPARAREAAPPAAAATAPEPVAATSARWPALVAGAAAAAAAGVFALRRRRRATPRVESTAETATQALAAAAEAAASGDCDAARRALSRALREALSAQLPDARSLSAQELVAAAGERGHALAALAAENEAARYRASVSPAAEREEVARLVAAARTALRG